MVATPAKKMRPIRAIIFDLDDTLVESTVDYVKFKTLVIERITSHGEPKDLYDPHETIVTIVARQGFPKSRSAIVWQSSTPSWTKLSWREYSKPDR
jgi:phosphoglycolate phosphatase-like HAD superfamily hydrolase